MWSLHLNTLRSQGSSVQKGAMASREDKENVIMAGFRVVQVDTQLHPAAPDYTGKKKIIRWHLPLNPMSTSCAWSIAWSVCYHIKKYVDQTVINQKEYLNNTSPTTHTGSSPLVICNFFFPCWTDFGTTIKHHWHQKTSKHKHTLFTFVHK